MIRNAPLVRALVLVLAALEVGARVLFYGTLALALVLGAILSAAFGRHER
jgi:ABC-type transport system involved in cytochrome c biogenesis permease subunit